MRTVAWRVIENSECIVPHHEGINIWLNFNLAYEMMHARVVNVITATPVYTVYTYLSLPYAVGNT